MGDADVAEDNSLRKTITIDDEFVRKSRKVSAGRFRERWPETERRKATRVCRHVSGNAISAGRIGEYHHLYSH